MADKLVVPSTPAELESMLGDDKQMKQVAAEGGLGEFIKNYAAAVNAKDASIGQQIRDETQRVLAEMLRDQPEGVQRLDVNPHQGPKAYRPVANPRAVGTPLNGLFKDLPEFMGAIFHNGNPGADVVKKVQSIRDYMERVPSEGGFLVPEEFRAEILRLALEAAIVRPRARVIPMSSQTLAFPMIDSTSNVSSVFGGIVVYRTEEGEELTESQASFGRVKLDATKQTALAHVTNELVRDAAGGFGVFIEQILPEALAYYEDLDFLVGNGAGQPLGALHSANTALITVSKESGQAASTLVWENIIRMYARMLPSSLASAVWIASPDTFVELATMALTVGTGGSAVWLTNGHDAPVLSLLGRPVILSEKAPAALGTLGDLSFVDFGMYLIGDRQEMTIDSSPHVKFTSDKTTWRVIQRNDGRPWLQSPITPHNSSATLSPFVQLETRS